MGEKEFKKNNALNSKKKKRGGRASPSRSRRKFLIINVPPGFLWCSFTDGKGRGGVKRSYGSGIHRQSDFDLFILYRVFGARSRKKKNKFKMLKKMLREASVQGRSSYYRALNGYII